MGEWCWLLGWMGVVCLRPCCADLMVGWVFARKRGRERGSGEMEEDIMGNYSNLCVDESGGRKRRNRGKERKEMEKGKMRV